MDIAVRDNIILFYGPHLHCCFWTPMILTVIEGLGKEGARIVSHGGTKLAIDFIAKERNETSVT